MYTPRPLPTPPPSFSPYQTWFDSVDQIFNRIVSMLRSVPVIPNPSGLYNPSTGEWYTPLVSMLDIIVAAILVGTFITLVFRLSGSAGSGTVSRGISHAK